MLQLSTSALTQVTQAFNSGNYATAYQIAYTDLRANYPNATGADADAITWIGVAQQVNSGAHTFDAVAIRASNKAADQLLNGTSIDLFGPEERDASNKIAAAFLTTVVDNNGTIPAFNDIVRIDAQQGLNALGLGVPSGNISPAWAGAVPDSISQAMTGFTTNSYYDNLSSAQQQTADQIHVMAGDLLAEYYAAPVSASNSYLNADLTLTAKNDAWVFNNLPGAGSAASFLVGGASSTADLWNRLKQAAQSGTPLSSADATAVDGDIQTAAQSTGVPSSEASLSDQVIPTILETASKITTPSTDPIQVVDSSSAGETLQDTSTGNLYWLSKGGGGAVASNNNNGTWTLEGLASGSPSTIIGGVQGTPSFDATTGNLAVPTTVGTYHIDPSTGDITDSGAVTATIGGETVTLLGLGGSSPFALISNDNSVSTASAVSSNVLAYPRWSGAARITSQPLSRRGGPSRISPVGGNRRARRQSSGSLCGFDVREGREGGGLRCQAAGRNRSSGGRTGYFEPSLGLVEVSGLPESAAISVAGHTRRLPVCGEPAKLSGKEWRSAHRCRHDVSILVGGHG